MVTSVKPTEERRRGLADTVGAVQALLGVSGLGKSSEGWQPED